jgi:hypothetical protein
MQVAELHKLHQELDMKGVDTGSSAKGDRSGDNRQNHVSKVFLQGCVDTSGYVSQAIANQAIAESEYCLKMVLNI